VAAATGVRNLRVAVLRASERASERAGVCCMRE
jgi:hypothetical protein